MNKLWILACLIVTHVKALENQVQFENENLCIAKIVLEPREVVGLHRDELEHVVFARKGGTIRRIGIDGRELDIELPTGQATYRPVDPVDELHKSVNMQDEPMELLIVYLKNSKP